MSMTKGMVLNYGQAMKLGDIEDKIELYVMTNYPDKSFGSPNNILGKFGKEFSKTTWGKSSKLKTSIHSFPTRRSSDHRKSVV